MLRTRQLRKKDDHEGLLKIFQLDQSAKSVAREEGVREFGWGEKLEGYGHCEWFLSFFSFCSMHGRLTARVRGCMEKSER